MISAPLMIQAATRDLADNNIVTICASGVPTDGTTGAGLCGKGSEYIDLATGKHYFNKGTLASPAWGIVTSA